ncbi:MAG: peptidylprolyl isomerase [Flavobacteriales bacterium]|nr:peptidylprolyl isomerase [Flavobacteriales bacterium]
MKNVILFVFVIAFCFSCNKDEKQAEEDRQIILDYIEDNDLDAIEGDQGLFYVVDVQGSGASPNSSSSVTVDYVGYFTDGDIFDQSGAGGSTFPLTSVIEGWQIGIPYYNEGGQGTLLIPSALGYGKDGSGSIPGNTVILFDIDLIDVQ